MVRTRGTRRREGERGMELATRAQIAYYDHGCPPAWSRRAWETYRSRPETRYGYVYGKRIVPRVSLDRTQRWSSECRGAVLTRSSAL